VGWASRTEYGLEYPPLYPPLADVVYGLADVVYGLASMVSGQTYSVLTVEGLEQWSGLAFALSYGQRYGQEYALAVGLAVGLAVRLGNLSAEPRQINPRVQGRGRELIRRLSIGLMYGLAVGLVGGMVFGLVDGVMRGMGTAATDLVYALAHGLEPGLMYGLLGGVTFGLVSFFRSSDLATRAVSPPRSHRGDRAVTLIEILIVGLLVGQVTGLLPGLEVGLTIGLVIGLAVGLAGVMNTLWLVFAAAAVRETLRRPRRLPAPWRVMPMLEDCYRLGRACHDSRVSHG
jgi:hypothetical protein